MKPSLYQVLILLTLVLGSALNSNGQKIHGEANYHSAAISINLLNTWDTDNNGWAEIRYRESGGKWFQAPLAVQIDYSNERHFRSSLFGLEPGTTYEVQVTIKDSIPTIDSVVLPALKLATKTEPVFTNTSSIKWVSPQGLGTDYTEIKPGNLKTLLASGLTCGTTVLLKDGSYYEGDMYLNIRENCTDSTPILIKAAPDAEPIIDGRLTSKLTWMQHTNDTLLYSASLPAEARYTNLLVLNGERLYPYSTLGNNVFLGNFNLSALNYGFNGFVRDATSISIKTEQGYDPNIEDVVVSSQFRGLSIQGFNHDVFLRIQGITFQYYGKSKVDLNGAFNARCLSIANANEVVIDHCIFKYCDAPVYFAGGCSNVTIQNTQIKDNIGSWSHAMIKKSVSNQNLLIPTSMGRSLENAGIYYNEGSNGSKNLIIRNCVIDGPGDGIGFRTATTGVYNVDFYNNTVKNCFDGVEFDNLFSNLKIWNNRIAHNVASISMAPPRLGPVYVYRNEVVDMVSRDNSKTDTYFTRCEPPTIYRSQGVGIKTNIGGPTTNGSFLRIFNNTFHSNDSAAFIQYLWDDEWSDIQFANNIFYNPSNNLFFNNGINGLNGQPDSSFQFSSDHDAYYSGNKPPLVIKKVHGQYDCLEVSSVDSIESIWSDQMKSSHISIDQFTSGDPMFVDESQGDFSLQKNSPLIERGKIIPGFYDYKGRSPDIGANESDEDSTLSVWVKIEDHDISIWPNPCTQTLTINSNSVRPFRSIDVFDVLGRSVFHTLNEEKDQRLRIAVADWKNGMYIVRVDTYYTKILKVDD